MQYRVQRNFLGAETIEKITGNFIISFSPENSDLYNELLAWKNLGNVPEIINSVSVSETATIDQRLEALELLVDYLLEGPTT